MKATKKTVATAGSQNAHVLENRLKVRLMTMLGSRHKDKISPCSGNQIVPVQTDVRRCSDKSTNTNRPTEEDDKEELEVLRQLALSSNSKRRKPQNDSYVEIEEDLTELRIEALRSAVLKRYKARKQKQLVGTKGLLEVSNPPSSCGQSSDCCNQELIGCAVSKRKIYKQCIDETTDVVNMDVVCIDDDDDKCYQPENWTPLIGDVPDDCSNTQKHSTGIGFFKASTVLKPLCGADSNMTHKPDLHPMASCSKPIEVQDVVMPHKCNPAIISNDMEVKSYVYNHKVKPQSRNKVKGVQSPYWQQMLLAEEAGRKLALLSSKANLSTSRENDTYLVKRKNVIVKRSFIARPKPLLNPISRVSAVSRYDSSSWRSKFAKGVTTRPCDLNWCKQIHPCGKKPSYKLDNTTNTPQRSGRFIIKVQDESESEEDQSQPENNISQTTSPVVASLTATVANPELKKEVEQFLNIYHEQADSGKCPETTTQSLNQNSCVAFPGSVQQAPEAKIEPIILPTNSVATEELNACPSFKPMDGGCSEDSADHFAILTLKFKCELEQELKCQKNVLRLQIDLAQARGKLDIQRKRICKVAAEVASYKHFRSSGENNTFYPISDESWLNSLETNLDGTLQLNEGQANIKL